MLLLTRSTAKFSRALIRRIYQHVLEEGWIQPNITLQVPENLIYYLTCLEDANVLIAENEHRASDVLSVQVEQGGLKRSSSVLLPYALPVARNLTIPPENPKHTVVQNAGTTEMEDSLSGNASNAERNLKHGHPQTESIVPINATEEPLLEINTKRARAKTGRPHSKMETQESVGQNIGNGEVESISNIMELNGKNLVDNSVTKLESVKPADQRKISKSTIRSPLDTAETMPGKTWRYYVLPVTEKLISLLIELFPHSFPLGKQAWLRNKQELIIFAPSPMTEGDTAIIIGDTVIDPFGGVSLGGLDAMRSGLHWVGVELEPRFVELGQQNIALWQALAERAAAWGLNGWGTATLLRGDSRQLSAVLGDAGAGLGVSSPPYAGSVNQSDQANDSMARLERKEQAGIDITHKPNVGGPNSVLNKPQVYGHTPGQLGAMAVSSPPYADGCQHTGGNDHPKPKYIQGGKLYGVGIAGAISSPPYAESLASDDPDKRGGLFRDPKRRNDKTLTAEYGTSPGQLGAMAVSSPPWEESLDRGTVNKDARVKLARELGITNAEHISPIDMERIGKRDQEYGDTAGQIGNDTGQDFWQAARAIIEQLRLCLRPGAHAVWVLKGFIRDKTYVDFPMQWAEMCQACGFEPIHWHRAWLVEEQTTPGLFGDSVSIKESKSFFRRLSEAKARAAQLWSDLPRGYQAMWLWRAHTDAWLTHYKQLEKMGHSVLPPTRRRIMEMAQMLAWKAAGKPRLEIDTAVDFEVVLCTRLVK